MNVWIAYCWDVVEEEPTSAMAFHDEASRARFLASPEGRYFHADGAFTGPLVLQGVAPQGTAIQVDRRGHAILSDQSINEITARVSGLIAMVGVPEK